MMMAAVIVMMAMTELRDYAEDEGAGDDKS